MGAGTYTGIEAVSNSMPVMREPRVATGKRTMRYMAFSLAITAGGLMVAYLLLDLRWTEEPTMNHSLCEQFVEAIGLPTWLGTTFLLITVMSEGCLLFVAAQAGFIDGPRVLANMARDSWMPHRLCAAFSVSDWPRITAFAADGVSRGLVRGCGRPAAM